MADKTEGELEALYLENRALIGTRVTDVKGLYFVMQQTCRALGNIGHLRPLSPLDYPLYQHSRAQEMDVAPADINMVLNPQTIESYKLLGSEEMVAPLQTHHASTPMEYLPEIRAVYVKFPSFYNYILVEQPVPIAEFLAKHPEAEHIIFDITMNPGGYGYIWMHHFVSVFTESVHWQARSYIRITDAIAWQYDGVEMIPIDANTAGLPSWVNDLGMTHQGYISTRLPVESYKGTKVDKPLKRRLLVDEGVASAAETFTRFCKDTGWATVVGTTTKGDGVVVADAPCMVRLDNTGLLLQFFVESGVNADGTPNAVRGTLPDYIKKPSETPLEACIRIIQNDCFIEE